MSFRIPIPLFHFGQVWDYDLNGRRWGFVWYFIEVTVNGYTGLMK